MAFTPHEVTAVSAIADKVIFFNSLSQLDRLALHVDGPEIGLRVNPGVSHSAFDLADPARRYSRLGVLDVEAVRRAASRLRGLMFHFNRENEDFDGLASTVNTSVSATPTCSSGWHG